MVRAAIAVVLVILVIAVCNREDDPAPTTSASTTTDPTTTTNTDRQFVPPTTPTQPTTTQQPTTTRPRPTTTRRPTAPQLADKCLSAWDGNHNGFEREVKKVLNDPDSMKVHGTYFNSNDSLADGTMTIRMDYSAANAFGGMVRANALAEMDRNCDITIIAYQ